MVEWTEAAKRELERYLTHVRQRLSPEEVDKNEVEDDLRRHITEKAHSSGLGIITQEDIQHFAEQMGLPAAEVKQMQQRTKDRKRRPKTKRLRFDLGGLAFFGIILPVIALALELFTGLCSSIYINPIPTIWHVLLVAMVPLANITAYVALRRNGTRHPKTVGWLNGLAFCIALYYAIIFLPLTPFAAIGILWLGLGLIPLSPLLSFISTCIVRAKLNQMLPNGTKPVLWKAIATSLLFIIIISIPGILTRTAIRQAALGHAQQKVTAIKLLRTFGNKDKLLRACYNIDRPFTDFSNYYFGGLEAPSEKEIQKVYYLVTGTPYNAVKPPDMRGFKGGRMTDAADWDFAQGGDKVAARVRGLTLSQSRIDGRIDSTACTAYTEWIMVFKNTSYRQREARATVALPAGSVVSRLTLWIDGEEREAAYAGRSKVKAAYKKVVKRRRDPVLVTTSGPDRILMQCFPVPPNGGTMKIKIGITSPLILTSPDSGLVRLPAFTEQNFGLEDSLKHTVWFEAPQPLNETGISEGLLNTITDNDKYIIKGSIDDDKLTATVAIAVRRNAAQTKCWTAAERGPQGFNVLQTIEAKTNTPPAALSIVIDGSARMAPYAEVIAETVEKLMHLTDCDIYIASDEIRHLTPKNGNGKSMPDSDIIKEIKKYKFCGGCDNVPALEPAWDSALASHGSVLWLHAAQPIEIMETEALLQRFERHPNTPVLYDYQFGAGLNLIANSLAYCSAYNSVPQLMGTKADLKLLSDQWGGILPLYGYNRQLTPVTNDVSKYVHTDLHIARLWANDKILKLSHSRKRGDHETAVKTAMDYQLVTPVSGAVVLETAKQYAEAGLTPSEAQASPAVVPEPATWALLLVGILILGANAARKYHRSKQQVPV